MDSWSVFIVIVLIGFSATYYFGVVSEKALSNKWVAQFKDQISNDVIVRVFSSKEIYEFSKELKNDKYKEASFYFNSVNEKIKDSVFTKRDKEFFNHPAISKPIAPMSFNIKRGHRPPEAVVNWLDLMAWFADQKLVKVYYENSGSKLQRNRQHKFTIDCPACGRGMKIPANKKIKVTCPHCGDKFMATT